MINFLKQIFFYIRKYLKLPRKNEFEVLKKQLNNIDSFYNIFSFINKEYMKWIKDDGFNNFRNNLPFTIYIKNKTKKNKYILWDSNNFGNVKLKKTINYWNPW